MINKSITQFDDNDFKKINEYHLDLFKKKCRKDIALFNTIEEPYFLSEYECDFNEETGEYVHKLLLSIHFKFIDDKLAFAHQVILDKENLDKIDYSSICENSVINFISTLERYFEYYEGQQKD